MSAPIPYELMKDLHNLYLQGTNKVASAAIEKGDTQTAWFELNADFRKFLEAVLKEDSGVTGIRMYFLQNPKDQEVIRGVMTPTKKEDVKQLSLAFVATKLEAGRQVDIEKEIEPMNHSSLCPSFCP
jgi:hypothetical protein